jgi:AraC family transcriptional regulator
MGNRVSALLVPVSLGSPDVRAADLDGFRVLAAAFPAGLSLPQHAHDRATLAIVLDGVFRKRLSRGVQECRPCTVIGEPAGERHSNDFGPRGARVLLLQPIPRSDDRGGGWRGLFEAPRFFLDARIVDLARRAFQELLEPDDLSPLALEALGTELFVAACRQSKAEYLERAPAWLSRLEELLHAHFTERLSMRSLAFEVGRHPVHVARVFRAHHGMTIAGYVRQLRIAWAQEQLRRRGSVAAQVALAAGFADQAHFTRTFRRVMGRPPSIWKRQAC